MVKNYGKCGWKKERGGDRERNRDEERAHTHTQKMAHANFTIEIVINGKIEKQTVSAGVCAFQICGYREDTLQTGTTDRA